MDKIKVSITFKDYFKLLFGLTYRKPIMCVILAVDILMITWIVLYNLNIKEIPEISYFQYSTVILITIVQPLVIFNTIKQNYYSAAHLKEKLEMEFTKTLLKIHGESFYTELLWEKTYKIEELRKWFLIYQNNLSAVIIPKKVLRKNQANEFIDFLKNIPHIKLLLLNGE